MRAGDGSWRRTGLRWLKFNFVGLIGIGVQLLALALLKSGLHLNYLLATALAVETAVVHNFLWHERFTWRDRVAKARLAVHKIQSDKRRNFHFRERSSDETLCGDDESAILGR